MEQRDEQLESAARALYEANANRVKPDWSQLGDATRSVWRGYVNQDPDWPFKYSVLAKEDTLHVSLHTSKPPDDPTAVSGASYARVPGAPTEWPTVTFTQERPLTLGERLARKGIK